MQGSTAGPGYAVAHPAYLLGLPLSFVEQKPGIKQLALGGS
jgi:hypothetical protein